MSSHVFGDDDSNWIATENNLLGTESNTVWAIITREREVGSQILQNPTIIPIMDIDERVEKKQIFKKWFSLLNKNRATRLFRTIEK